VHGQLASGANLSQLTVQLDVVVRPQLTWSMPAACGLPWRLAEI